MSAEPPPAQPPSPVPEAAVLAPAESAWVSDLSGSDSESEGGGSNLASDLGWAAADDGALAAELLLEPEERACLIADLRELGETRFDQYTRFQSEEPDRDGLGACRTESCA